MEARDLSYTNGRVTMAYTETPGPAVPDSRTYLLVHGIGMGRVVFAGVAEKLRGSGRVLAIDLPGFGDSPEPGSATSLEHTADVVAQFLRDRAPGRSVLVGHSMGTQIVAEIAARWPELAEAVVMIAPTVNRRERSAARQGLRMVQDLFGETPKVLLLGIWEYAKTSPLWYWRKLQFMLAHRIEHVCPKIGVPTLVLSGEEDRVCPPEWNAEVAAAVPESVSQLIPGRGHEAIIRSAEPVASMILSFLGSRRL
ncbi:alpha/beta fold hydrolase [Leucobacter sp. USHLN153]|uniref:alpha/beta fold hydrolase n=1 Tax=Leucobacter sp. USHLN153 TaxID=3081268 RepID=UPI00301AE87A